MVSSKNHSNQSEPEPESKSTDVFWDKADRIAVMIMGGAALGSAIAQLPGAIVSGVLAAGYGWYINFAKPQTKRN